MDNTSNRSVYSKKTNNSSNQWHQQKRGGNSSNSNMSNISGNKGSFSTNQDRNRNHNGTSTVRTGGGMKSHSNISNDHGWKKGSGSGNNINHNFTERFSNERRNDFLESMTLDDVYNSLDKSKHSWYDIGRIKIVSKTSNGFNSFSNSNIGFGKSI